MLNQTQIEEWLKTIKMKKKMVNKVTAFISDDLAAV